MRETGLQGEVLQIMLNIIDILMRWKLANDKNRFNILIIATTIMQLNRIVSELERLRAMHTTRRMCNIVCYIYPIKWQQIAHSIASDIRVDV